MIPLSETLVALVESLEAPEHCGLVVESALIDLPLEGNVVATRGAPMFLATVPHTRWRAGVLPQVHVAHFELGQRPPEAAG